MFPVVSVQPVNARGSLSSYHGTEYSTSSREGYSDSGSEAGSEGSEWKVPAGSDAMSPFEVEPLRSDTPLHRMTPSFRGDSRRSGPSEPGALGFSPHNAKTEWHVRTDSHAHSQGHSSDGTNDFDRLNALLSAAGFAPVSQSLDPASTLALVHRLVLTLNALHSVHAHAQDTHSFLLSDNTILSDRVVRLRRDVAERDAAVLKLKELRREADENTKVAQARIKALERELKTLKNDFIALAQKVGGCCDNGIKNFARSPSKAAKHVIACAKCYSKLRQSKGCTAHWIEGVGFIENEPSSTTIVSPSVGSARRRVKSGSDRIPSPHTSPTPKRPMSVPSSPFSSPINKPFLPASKSPSNSILSPKPMPAPSTPTSFRIASSSSEDLQESVQVTRPLRRSSSTSRIIPTLNPDNIPAGAVLKRTSSLSRGRCLTVKTVASDFDMNASTADTATNTVVETKPLLADSSSSPRTNFFTDATTETDLNITSFEVLIQKQQELIESLLTDQTPPDNFASPVTIEPTQSLTDMAVRYASLEEERILLTEAAMEIGEARVALKKERDEFLDEVRAFRTLQVLVGLDEVIGVDPPSQAVSNEAPHAEQPSEVSEQLPVPEPHAFICDPAVVNEPAVVSERAVVTEPADAIEEIPVTASAALAVDITLVQESSPNSPSTMAPTSPTSSPHKIVLRPSTRSLIASYENFKSFRPLTPNETPIVATHAVVRAYTPSSHTDEIVLSRGDLVHVERVFADSWCRVMNLSSSRKNVFGFVPLGCLKEVHGGASRVCVVEEGDGERSWVGAVGSTRRNVRFREQVQEIGSWWGRERMESLEAPADAEG